ncbi:MAG: hypothetical protein MPJ79_02335 [Alphaproteobacteria bacterium]|nr:hypothetical protein [Alphaproteobacteria bacterium]MDA7988414.1 hypothetical protein [Alphaproteobacteria bacterium]MDA8008807.1 hypothetical protein [Alphaproteobacteria bacterium]
MNMPEDLKTRGEIDAWAARYKIPDIEKGLTSRLKNSSDPITKNDLCDIVRWHSSRILWRAEKNRDEDVILTSRRAFESDSDVGRVEILSDLQGVGWSVASAVLHLAHADDYPIFSKYSALAVNAPYRYNGEPWRQYVALCRKTAQEHDISMRTLDRGTDHLWLLQIQRRIALSLRRTSGGGGVVTV